MLQTPNSPDSPSHWAWMQLCHEWLWFLQQFIGTPYPRMQKEDLSTLRRRPEKPRPLTFWLFLAPTANVGPKSKVCHVYLSWAQYSTGQRMWQTVGWGPSGRLIENSHFHLQCWRFFIACNIIPMFLLLMCFLSPSLHGIGMCMTELLKKNNNNKNT